MHQARRPKPKNGFHTVGKSRGGPRVTQKEQSGADGDEHGEVFYEMRPIEIDGVFAAFARREVPDGNPRQSYREGRPCGSEYRNENEVERNVHREADEEDAQTLFDPARSRHDLEIDLEEEIENEERCGPCQNPTGFIEFRSEERYGEIRSEQPEGEARGNGRDGEVLGEEFPY